DQSSMEGRKKSDTLGDVPHCIAKNYLNHEPRNIIRGA
ncbi:unnamed protein product, partial [marine sediment metagenome]